MDASRVSNVEELSGRGVRATVDGRQICAGNDKLMEDIGVSWHPCHRVGTTVHVASDGVYLGHIVISDEVKPDAKEAITALRPVVCAEPSCSPATPKPWVSQWHRSWAWTRYTPSSSPPTR